MPSLTLPFEESETGKAKEYRRGRFVYASLDKSSFGTAVRGPMAWAFLMDLGATHLSTSLASDLCKERHRPTDVTSHRGRTFDPTTTNPCGALCSALYCPAVRNVLAGTFSTSTSYFTPSIMPTASGVSV